MLNSQESNFSQPLNPLTVGLDSLNLVSPLEELGKVQGAYTPGLNIFPVTEAENIPTIQLEPSQISVNQELNSAVAKEYGLLGTGDIIVGDFSKKDDLLLTGGMREIVFVDSAVDNYQSLNTGINQNSEIIRLDANRDGIEQITQVLSHHQNISAVHIVSHGTVGGIELGSATLSKYTLPHYQTDLKQWANALTTNADILLYGCDVAEGKTGQTFIQQLATLTDADIAASTDLTGNANLGGNWVLESETGSIQASALVGNNEFNQVLSVVILENGKLSYTSSLPGQAPNNFITVTKIDNFLRISEKSNNLTSLDTQNTNIQQIDDNTVQINLSSISEISIDTGPNGDDTVDFQELNLNEKVDINVSFGTLNPGQETISFNGAVSLAAGSLSIKDADLVDFEKNVSLGGSLTIKDSDEIKLFGNNILLNGGDLSITGAKTVTVTNDSTISTRRIASNALPNYLSDDSVGDSGNITINGSDISFGKKVNLLAQASSGYEAGNIRISAASAKDGITDQLTDFGLGGTTYKAKITLGENVIFKGQDIILNAEAGGDKGDANILQKYSGKGLRSIADIIVGLPVAVKVIDTNAKIEVGYQSQIISSGNVSIQTNAIADSSLSVSTSENDLLKFLSVGVSIAKASATSSIQNGVQIQAAKNVDILSNVTSTASANSRTSRNLGVKPKEKQATALSFAIAYSNAESIANVNQGTLIQAGGNVNVYAKGISNNKAASSAGIYDDGTVAFTVGVGVSDSNIKATVDGRIEAKGTQEGLKNFDLDSATIDSTTNTLKFNRAHNLKTGDALIYRQGNVGNTGINGLNDTFTYYAIVVDPTTIKLAKSQILATSSGGSGINLSIIPQTGRGFLDGDFRTQGIGISAKLESSDIATASSGIVEDTLKNKILAFDTSALTSAARSSDALKQKLQEKFGPNRTLVNKGVPGSGGSAGDSKTSWGVAGAIAYSDSSHNVTAQVGSNAVLLSEQNIDINANHQAVVEVSSASELALGNNKNKETAVSAAVGVGNYGSNVKAVIADKAKLDAKEKIAIKAETVYPFPWKIAIGKPTPFPDLSAKNEKEAQSLMEKYEGNLINTNDNVTNTGDDIEALKAKPWTSWTKSTAKGEKLGIAGAVNVLNFNNIVEASVGSGVLINQGIDSRYKSERQTLSVAAKTDMVLMNITGNPIERLGNTEGAGGVGGSVFVQNINNSTQALIKDGAKIATGSQGTFRLNATDDVNQYNLVYAGGSAGKFGISAAVAVNLTNSKTIAQLSNLAQVSGGNVEITALNNANYWNFVGGIIKGQGVGLGVSVAINDITRNTQAFIGSFAPKSTSRSSTNTINSTGAVKISATNSGNLVTASLAGAISGPPTDASGAKNAAGSYGLGISGSVSINQIQDTTEASVQNAQIAQATDLSVTTKNNSNIVSISGGASLSLDPSKKGGSLAGSYSNNDLDGSTKTYITNSSINLTGDLNLTTTLDQKITAIGISGSLSSSNSGVALAGQVMLNDIKRKETSAYINANSTINQAKNIQIKAEDKSNIFAIAGAVSVDLAGQAAVGGSYSKNKIRSKTRAYIDNAQVNITGSLGIVALNNSKMNTVSVGAAVSVKGFALTVAYTNNDIINDTQAYIFNSGAINVTGTKKIVVPNATTPDKEEKTLGVAVIALNTAEINSVAIVLSGGGQVAATGNVSNNDIQNVTKAYIDNAKISSQESVFVRGYSLADIDVKAGAVSIAGTGAAGASVDVTDIANNTEVVVRNSTVTAKSNIEVTSFTREQVDAVVISGAISGLVSIAGNVEILTLNSTNNAFINQSTVNADGNLQVIADNIASIGENKEFNVQGKDAAVKAVGVGSVAVGIGGGGAGASVLVTNITNKTTAYITDSTTNAKQLTEVKANTAEIVSTLAATAAGGLYAGIAGSIISNLVETKTTAYIQENTGGTTQVNQNLAYQTNSQSVKVLATNNAKINSFVGGVGAGLAGVGASADINTISNITEAFIGNGIEVKAGQDVEVLADAKKSVKSVAVAFSAGAVSLQGAISIVNIGGGTSEAGNNALKPVDKNGNTGSKTFASSIDQEITSARKTTNRSTSLSLVRLFNSSSDFQQYTKAYIGNNTVVDAGQNIRVNATDETKLELDPGALGLGLASLGGAFGIVNFNNDIQAFTGTGVKLDAAGKVEIQANSYVLPLPTNGSMVESRAAGGGIISLAGSIAAIDSNNNAIAYIGDGSNIGQNKNLGSLQINANTQSTLSADADGLGIGAVAGGLSFAKVNEKGSTRAYLGAIVNVGRSDQRIGSFNIQANSTQKINAQSQALAGGIISGAGSKSETSVTPKVDTYIGKKSNIFTNNDAQVRALVNGEVSTAVKGIGLSFLAAGGQSIANTTWNPTVEARLDETTQINSGGNVKIEASSNTKNINAEANASGGALVGGNGADAKTGINSNVTAKTGDTAKITAQNNIDIIANTNNQNTAVAGVNTLGVIAVGSSKAQSEIKSNTQAFTGTGVALTSINGSISILSQSNNNNNRVEAKATSGGVFAQGGTEAKSNLNNTTIARLGENNVVTANAKDGSNAGTFNIRASNGGRIEAYSEQNIYSAVDIDNISSSYVNVQSSTQALIRGDSNIKVRKLSILTDVQLYLNPYAKAASNSLYARNLRAYGKITDSKVTALTEISGYTVIRANEVEAQSQQNVNSIAGSSVDGQGPGDDEAYTESSLKVDSRVNFEYGVIIVANSVNATADSLGDNQQNPSDYDALSKNDEFRSGSRNNLKNVNRSDEHIKGNLNNVVVNTLDDGIFARDGKIPLRVALLAVKDGGTITFSDSLFSSANVGLITLNNSLQQHNPSLDISRSVTIDAGNNRQITVQQFDGKSRVFRVDDLSSDTTISVILKNLTIRGLGIVGGGGISNNENLSLINTQVNDSSPNVGGGISNNGTLTLFNSSLSGNSSFNIGGGIYNVGTLTLTNSTLSGNISQNNGGGIYNDGTLNLFNSTLSGNISKNSGGGGIYNDGTLNLFNSTLSGNISKDQGGGIYNYNNGRFNLFNSTLSGNISQNSGGGGIYNVGGTSALTNSTLSGNISEKYGGGGIFNNGTLALTNSTLSGNISQNSGGGGIYNDGTLNLFNSTLSGNISKDQGGGIYNYSNGRFNLTNSIIANSKSADLSDLSLYRGINSYYGINLIADGSITGANIINKDPLLAPLNFYGGFTQTHALLPGSPAIDASDTGIATDQRGLTRPISGKYDIGAFELQKFDFSSVLTDDVIVNRTGDKTDNTQSAIDNSKNSLITQSFAKFAGGTSGNGLPDNGFFAANSFHPDIQLSYNNSNNGNNARLINGTDKFTFAIPSDQYKAVHLALTSTEGKSQIELTFNYSDGTSKTTKSQTIPDWFDSITETNDLYYLIDRLDRSQADGSGFEDKNDPAVFGAMFIPDVTKKLISITVAKTSGVGKLVFLGATALRYQA